MATVQHLEKLYYVKELFESTESLESAVACERINILIAQTEKVGKTLFTCLLISSIFLRFSSFIRGPFFVMSEED